MLITPQGLDKCQTLMIQVGDLFTTLKSKKTGVIKEIIPNASGSVRVLLEMPTKETRWTTVSNEALV
jgi:hypothetical protein